jgi:hypothetical protein
MMWSNIWEGIKDLGRALKFWDWPKVRRANISDDVRERIEEFGEHGLSYALGVQYMNPKIHGEKLDRLINDVTPDDRFAWLLERHSVAERRKRRLETVEVAILLFLFLEVCHDFIPLPWR